MLHKLKIGVFDSGVGGLSVAEAIQRAFPDSDVFFENDAEHVPYGTRDIEEIYKFCKPILQKLIDQGCQVIVVACNTVSTNLIEKLRKDFSLPLVAMEPMVKPAAESTKTGVIAVCATPKTLSSRRYQWLKVQYANDVRVIEPDCRDWTSMIENNKVDREKIAKIVNEAVSAGADKIVLGCTHYHWIEELIKDLVKNRAEVLQPEVPVIAQLRRVLLRLT